MELGFIILFPKASSAPIFFPGSRQRQRKIMGVSSFMAFRKPVQPAVTGFMLWFSGHFSWCLMAHLPSNPVFCCISGNVTVLRTQPHARKYTLFFPSVKAPAAVRVHSAMTFSAKFLNFPDISKKFFTETYPLIPALSGGIFCNHTSKQYIALHYLRIFRMKRQKKKHRIMFASTFTVIAK